MDRGGPSLQFSIPRKAKNSNVIEKQVSEKMVTSTKDMMHSYYSFFFAFSVLIKASGQLGQCVENRSVGCDITDRTLARKIAN